jgi:fatty acid desaturase
MWRYSGWDSILAAFPLLQFGLMVVWAKIFPELSIDQNISLIAPAALLFYFNPIVVTHNFLHTPFFRTKILNLLFSLLNSINLLLPQSLYKHHHLLHHRYNNDPTAQGTTQDPSSTWRYGRRGAQEHWLPYCALSLLRDSTSLAFAELKRRGDLPLFYSELSICLASFGAWLIYDWRFALAAVLPTFYLGWFLAHLENYFEHHLARDPHDRFANSVSVLSPGYNLLMFNEGYHQAHHITPSRHWTLRPTVHARYAEKMKESKARLALWPPLLGFFESPDTPSDSPPSISPSVKF